MSTRPLIASSTGLCALLLHVGAWAAPFQNGSFELPGVGAGGFRDISSQAQAPTGWTPSGTLGNAALFYEGNGTFGTPSQDGVNMIGFGGNGQTGAVLGQTFDTVAGDTYTVSYFTTAQQLGNGPQSYSAQAVDDAPGSALLATDAQSIPVVLAWVPHTLTFTALSSATTIRFTDTSNGSAAGSINWALDNVQVSSVPEPGSWAMLGLGTLAVLLRRQRSKRA
jgi:hypothetical protein